MATLTVNNVSRMPVIDTGVTMDNSGNNMNLKYNNNGVLYGVFKNHNNNIEIKEIIIDHIKNYISKLDDPNKIQNSEMLKTSVTLYNGLIQNQNYTFEKPTKMQIQLARAIKDYFENNGIHIINIV